MRESVPEACIHLCRGSAVVRHSVPKITCLQGSGGSSDLKERLHFPVQELVSPWAAVEQFGVGCTRPRDCNFFALQLLCSCQDCYWKTVFFQ